jgi:HPt (histidine-containing phosphotransfer) domain-containing protein
VELRDLQEAGEPDLLHELIEMFITDAEPRLTSLRTAIAQGDAPMVEREAHALKGSCANFGAQPMVRICHDLQVLGRSHVLTTAPGLLAHLEAEYTRVRAALTAVMAKDGYAHSDR